MHIRDFDKYNIFLPVIDRYYSIYYDYSLRMLKYFK